MEQYVLGIDGANQGCREQMAQSRQSLEYDTGGRQNKKVTSATDVEKPRGGPTIGSVRIFVWPKSLVDFNTSSEVRSKALCE